VDPTPSSRKAESMEAVEDSYLIVTLDLAVEAEGRGGG
jgi:hypothetical protein